MRCYFSHDFDPNSVFPFCREQFMTGKGKNMESANTALHAEAGAWRMRPLDN
jgi:hypothetical protein